MVERLKNGKMTDCVKKAQMQSGIVVTKDPPSTCTDCPLSDQYSGRGAMTIRLEREGKLYGLLSASIARDFIADAEEQSLLQEVAMDISFALNSIELEEERKQAEEELDKHREHLEDIVRERTTELEKRVSEVEQLNSAMVNLMEDLRVSNESLKTTTRQLANANKELEAFAYSVSHDLRAPLRAIDGFNQVLLEEYANKLDEAGRHYLERVRAGTQRMGQLIDDILKLSRAALSAYNDWTLTP
ncbi:MAG: hypothetical protein JRJ45_10295 [Deltaproteobacteria bacterium]|nr:hypothetical protein [Deltaproteobacteria bacterium]